MAFHKLKEEWDRTAVYWCRLPINTYVGKKEEEESEIEQMSTSCG